MTNLELSMALVQEHVDNLDLAHVAVLLELLSNLGAYGGHGEVQGVHCLDFGGLYIISISHLVR